MLELFLKFLLGLLVRLVMCLFILYSLVSMHHCFLLSMRTSSDPAVRVEGSGEMSLDPGAKN